MLVLLVAVLENGRAKAKPSAQNLTTPIRKGIFFLFLP
jgi:hypothetical protein